MELSWSTFLLEIINFIVLIWILKRFLYKPVLDVIAKRRAGIEESLAKAQRLHEEANTLKGEYEERLSKWERERRRARETLTAEIEAERVRQLKALQSALDKEREKAQVAESRQRAQAIRETEHKALQQGGQFAARLLALASGPELEARLLDMALENISNLYEEQVTALRTQWGEQPETIMVSSAYNLSEEQRQRLQQALSELCGLNLPINYLQEPELLAGLRVTIGPWVLHANVQNELQAFAEFAHAAR